MTGAERIAAERKRQIEAEGWTPEHDDKFKSGELAAAAESYLLALVEPDEDAWRLGETRQPFSWPWDGAWWKPSDDPIRNLEKAGALIAAEIDRRIRAAKEGA